MGYDLAEHDRLHRRPTARSWPNNGGIEHADEGDDAERRFLAAIWPRPMADRECDHGRLPGDRSPACGCWHDE